MNGVKSTYLLLVFYGFLILAASSDPESSLNDLYENLLQREYTGPISFPNHQVERKAQRSPSLRLRFGRRSDPSMQLLDKRFDEINQKPIRSPSLRLRFGKRDQSIPAYGDDYFTNDIDMRRDLRAPAPAPRLRWGRRNDPDVPLTGDDSVFNELDVQPEKRKPVRLRWGRSYNSGAEEYSGTSSTLAESANKLNTVATDSRLGL